MTRDQSQIVFFQWLSVHDPKLFASVAAKNFRSQGLGGLGWIAAAVNALIQVGGAVMQKKQTDQQLKLQKKTLAAQDAQLAVDRANTLKIALLDINAKRAANGLGPVDISGNLIPSSALPMPSSLAPFAQSAGIATNYTPWILGGAAALLGLFMVSRGR